MFNSKQWEMNVTDPASYFGHRTETVKHETSSPSRYRTSL